MLPHCHCILLYSCLVTVPGTNLILIAQALQLFSMWHTWGSRTVHSSVNPRKARRDSHILEGSAAREDNLIIIYFTWSGMVRNCGAICGIESTYDRWSIRQHTPTQTENNFKCQWERGGVLKTILWLWADLIVHGLASKSTQRRVADIACTVCLVVVLSPPPRPME